MAISNYELANKPYTRGFGDNTVTVVEIRLSEGNRYSTNMRELTGDRTTEQEDVLIQAVLDIIKAELDPASAIIQTQAKLEEATHKLAETEAKQTATDQAVKHNQEETDRYGKIIHAVVLNAVAGKTIAYGTIYKELVELIPLAEVGKHYMAHDLITIEDPAHVEVNGECLFQIDAVTPDDESSETSPRSSSFFIHAGTRHIDSPIAMQSALQRPVYRP